MQHSCCYQIRILSLGSGRYKLGGFGEMVDMWFLGLLLRLCVVWRCATIPTLAALTSIVTSVNHIAFVRAELHDGLFADQFVSFCTQLIHRSLHPCQQQFRRRSTNAGTLKREDLFLLPTNLEAQPFDLSADELKSRSALKSSGTSPNCLITLASLKSPVAGSPVLLKATAPTCPSLRDNASARITTPTGLKHSRVRQRQCRHRRRRTKAQVISRHLSGTNILKLLKYAEDNKNNTKGLEAYAGGLRPNKRKRCVLLYFTPNQYRCYEKAVLKLRAKKSGRGLVGKEKATIKMAKKVLAD
jgi:hypothetical protein